MTNHELAIIVAAAFAGALGSGLAGWWDSHEPFDGRKFAGTVWRALFAAFGFASLNQFVKTEGSVWVWAFLAGAGVDGLGNHVQGGLAGRSNTEAEIERLVAINKDLTERLERTLVDLADRRQGHG